MQEAQEDPLIGELVGGRYRVIRVLGEGGMGHVYLAEHEAIQKKIALKVLRTEYSRKEEIVSRFHQEAISASRIKHPNVLDVFDFGKLETGAAFLAMEYLEGNDVADELGIKGYLDVERALRITLQICRALAAAHSAGVVHRDMKPDNVFLQRTADGEEIVKIVDFGIAQLRTTEEAAESERRPRRLTRTGMIFGTPEYMAPEQAAGKKADRRVDVYAVGIILYEMFTGAVPFTGETFMAVLAAHLNDPPPPLTEAKPDLQISAELQAVVMQALSKKPEERFEAMADFATALLNTPEGIRLGSVSPGLDQRASQFPSVRPQGKPLDTAVLDRSEPGGTSSAGASRIPSPPGLPTELDLRDPAVRANTQLNASGTSPPTGSSNTLVWATLGAVVVFVGLGALLVAPRLGSDVGAAEQPEADSDPSATPLASAAPEPEPAPTNSGPLVEPAELELASRVTISVETVPAGAVLKKDGFQVCDVTPCQVVADPGDGFQLTATKDSLSGMAKVLAQKDQSVTITLLPPRVNRANTPAGSKGATAEKDTPSTEGRLCEVQVGDLKILRPCKQP